MTTTYPQKANFGASKGWRNDPISEGQISFLTSLCEQLGWETDNLTNLTKGQASDFITEAKTQIAQQKAQAPAEAVEEITPAVPQGYYTVVKDGTHRTFRVKQAGPNSKLAGKYIISFLSGPDNTSSYTGFGFVTEDGVSVWKRFAESDWDFWLEALLADSKTAGKAYALESGNCFVCNRLLTDPESIELGIGPVCRDGF